MQCSGYALVRILPYHASPETRADNTGVIGISTFYRAYKDLILIRRDALVTKEEKGLEIINQGTEDCMCRLSMISKVNRRSHFSQVTGRLVGKPEL